MAPVCTRSPSRTASTCSEAAVAGAIPLLRPLRESLAGDRVQRVLGIVNGTTNYILTKMDEEAPTTTRCSPRRSGSVTPGGPHRRRRGPTRGKGRHSRNYGLPLQRHAVRPTSTAGIGSVTLRDVEAARDLGFVIKLLAVAERTSDSGSSPWCTRHGAAVTPLASVRDAFNARCSWKRNPPAR